MRFNHFRSFSLSNSHIWEPHESHTIPGTWRFDTFGIAVFILLRLCFCTHIKCTFWPIVCTLSRMDRTTIAATRIFYFSHHPIDAPYSIRSISLSSHSMWLICCMCWTSTTFRRQSTSFSHAALWFVLIFTGKHSPLRRACAWNFLIDLFRFRSFHFATDWNISPWCLMFC